MSNNYPPLGLFITGTNTEVGKTYVTSLIAKSLRKQNKVVGVYKPAASGCYLEQGQLVSEDAQAIWLAADQPESLPRVCPQMFQAPIAPHLAAQAEGKQLDEELLRTGLEYWKDRCDIVLVEGAGGLMSPLSDDSYVADLAFDFGYPLIVVAANELGVINQTLQTLITAAVFRDGLETAGVVLNQASAATNDQSLTTNRKELQARCTPPLLAEVAWQADDFDTDVDWFELAQNATENSAVAQHSESQGPDQELN